jgi:ribosomal protein S18 acetylase RimI-like enzyme
MDFVIELLFEIIGEIIEAVIESDRVPKWIRYSLIGVLLGGILVLIGVAIIHATEVVMTIFLSFVALGLVALLIFLMYNIHRSGVLRQARKEELPEILKIYRSVIGKPGCNWSITYPNEATLYEDFRTSNLYVLYKGKQLIGAGSIVARNELDDLNCWKHQENVREIARIVIKPEFQSKGYGKHLVRKLCIQAEKSGATAIHMLVSGGNHHALNLYRETGFHNRGQCHRFDHDYYAYEKHLSAD